MRHPPGRCVARVTHRETRNDSTGTTCLGWIHTPRCPGARCRTARVEPRARKDRARGTSARTRSRDAGSAKRYQQRRGCLERAVAEGVSIQIGAGRACSVIEERPVFWSQAASGRSSQSSSAKLSDTSSSLGSLDVPSSSAVFKRQNLGHVTGCLCARRGWLRGTSALRWAVGADRTGGFAPQIAGRCIGCCEHRPRDCHEGNPPSLRRVTNHSHGDPLARDPNNRPAYSSRAVRIRQPQNVDIARRPAAPTDRP